MTSTITNKNRIDMLRTHFAKRLTSTASAIGFQATVGVKRPTDVVIVAALRTPLTRAKKGALASVHPEQMLSAVLQGILKKSKLEAALVEDICVGNVLPPGGGATTARIAVLAAGFPATTSLMTVNRQCSSGLQAVACIASAIQAGHISIGIGAGVESMSMHYVPENLMPQVSAEVLEKHPQTKDCLLPMGETSERVAEEFGVTRAEQDAFAADSHRKALEAQQAGFFAAEICPVVLDDGTMVDKDDGIRPNVTVDTLAKLRPVFRENGTTTAGNASQVTDGAAAVLLMTRQRATELNLPVLGKFVGFCAVGVPPAVMGIGPAFAIPQLLRKANVPASNVDIFEINEAFASQSAYCIRVLQLPEDKVNVVGGAIALGHPLGATGARQVATVLNQLARRHQRLAVVSMCIGTGMGAAALIENERL